MITLTLKQVMEMWLQNRPSATQVNYRWLIETVQKLSLSLFSKNLLDLEQTELLYLASRMGDKIKPATHATRIFQVKSLFKFAQQLKLRSDNPALLLRAPKHEDVLADRIVSRSEIESMVALCSKPGDDLIIKLGYIAGLRLAEMTGLRVKDVLLQGDVHVLRVYGKGQKTGYVRIPEDLASEILALVEGLMPDDYLLTRREPNERGHKVSKSTVYQRVKRLARKAGVPKVSPHFFRHGHASAALANNVDLVTLQRSLRHSSIQTTTRYIHLKQDTGSAMFITPLVKPLLPSTPHQQQPDANGQVPVSECEPDGN